MKLQFVLIGCLACGVASVYGSQKDESDVLVEEIGKYPNLVKAIQKLVQYVIRSGPTQLQNNDNDMVTLGNDVHVTEANVYQDEISDSKEDTSEDYDENEYYNTMDKYEYDDMMAADEDDDSMVKFNPTESPLIGQCVSILEPLLNNNCWNNALIHDARKMLNNLTGSIANKTDFEISIYITAVEEYFRQRLLVKVPKSISYQAALLDTLQTYYKNTEHRMQQTNATVSLLQDALSTINKKIEKECYKTTQAPEITCDQSVLKWYRRVIKECPQYKAVLQLHNDVAKFKREWREVKNDLFETISKETGARTFALTEKKYEKMLNLGYAVYSSIPTAMNASERCRSVLRL